MDTSPQRYMTQPDFMSWRMEEDPVLRSTIVAVALLDASPDRERFVRMIERGIERVPIFRQKVVTDSLLPTPPRWEDDPHFDLDWHLRRFTVAEAGGWEAVLDFVRTAGMTAFDKDRPLWEFTVLDGLDGGRAALVMKVHHSLTDGVGGMQIAREMVDFTRDGTDRAALPNSPSTQFDEAAPDGAGALGWYWDGVTALAFEGARSLVRGGVRLVTEPVGMLRDAAAVAESTLRLARPVLTTLSPVMRKRSTRRRMAALDVPMSGLSRAASAAGCSINDAFLASILLGMQRYHRLHGVEIPELRMTLPINLRADGDPMGGNRVTLARFVVPIDIDDPIELMHCVHDTVAAWRREPAIPLSAKIAGGLNLLPAATLGNMFKHVDFVASDVVGSPVPLFVAGAELLRYYAFGPTLGSAFNVTLMSYTSYCCVGIDADADAVPDLAEFTAALADGFREVLALCPDGTADTTVVTP